MSNYAIGSVNGHYQQLLQLLETIQFTPEQDVLWFTGNLINGGPDGLAVLRFIKNLGKAAVTVLGNQELHLLAVAEGFSPAEANDNFAGILTAEDRDDLLKWLRKRSLIHHDAKLNYTLVHGGIPAEWTFSQALTFAYEVESVLSAGNYKAFLENRSCGQSRWHAKLTGWKRLSFISNAYSLMKYCNTQGKLDFHAQGPINQQAEGLIPWYRVPGRITANLNIVFADDAQFGDENYPGIYPLSSPQGLCALKLDGSTESFSVQ